MDRRVIDSADFRESYRLPLTQPPAAVTDIFLAVFGHHPRWLKCVLIARHVFARWCGLDAATAGEIMNPAVTHERGRCVRVGPWPVFSLTATELIAGRDNRHLDFRVSVLRVVQGEAAQVAVTTVCTAHNAFGRLYLRIVIPFHRWGMRRLMWRALAAGRL